MVKKRLYKYELWLVKAFPFLLAAMSIMQNFLSYTNIDLFGISQLGGLSLLSLLFVYLSSFAFGFKLSHRIFIYFVVIDWITTIVDYYIGIPLSNDSLLYLLIIFFLVSVVATIILGIKERKQSYTEECKGEEIENVHRSLIKYEIAVIRIIPMVLSGICLLNSILSCFYIDWPILSFLGSASLLMVLFMYLSSLVFGFCAYHRIFIHFLAFTIILNLVDWYLDPFSNIRLEVCVIYCLLGISVFIFAILKLRKNHVADEQLCK